MYGIQGNTTCATCIQGKTTRLCGIQGNAICARCVKGKIIRLCGIQGNTVCARCFQGSSAGAICILGGEIWYPNGIQGKALRVNSFQTGETQPVQTISVNVKGGC